MKKFYQKVDRRSRKAMTAFLQNHFRYNTANSWNGSTSYACNMKVHKLGLDNATTDKLFDLVQTEEFHDNIRELTREFNESHDYIWQAGFNGKNGGYLVLYRGGREPSGYKSYCKCGQLNYKSVTESGNVCGRCRLPNRKDFTSTHMRVFTMSGRNVDQHEDYFEWDLNTLRDRVELICEFDKLADMIVAEAVYIASEYDVEVQTFSKTYTKMVMVEKAGAA